VDRVEQLEIESEHEDEKVGVLHPSDEDELANSPHEVRENEYENENEIENENEYGVHDFEDIQSNTEDGKKVHDVADESEYASVASPERELQRYNRGWNNNQWNRRGYNNGWNNNGWNNNGWNNYRYNNYRYNNYRYNNGYNNGWNNNGWNNNGWNNNGWNNNGFFYNDILI